VTLDEALDHLSDVPELSHRSLFGGNGFYTAGRIFGFLDDGKIFLKGDSHCRADYEDAGGIMFEYMSHKGPQPMKYWRFKDLETTLSLVSEAIACAHRAPKPKPKVNRTK
jgi:TfoX/Sxy family transcriptional regulator of competence genes